MNCKPGDLAVMVRSKCGNEGALFLVLDKENARPGEWRVRTLSSARNEFGWIAPPGEIGYAIDAYLRPIRDPGEDATDETLVFAGKPRSLFSPKQTEQTA